MTTKATPTRDQILDAVRSWPPDDQLSLAYDILLTLEPDSPSPEQQRQALERLRGMAKTAAPPPTDESVRRWLDEHRMAKYG